MLVTDLITTRETLGPSPVSIVAELYNWMVIAVISIRAAIFTPRSLFVTTLIFSLPQSQFFLKNPSLKPSFILHFQVPPFISPMASFITAEYAKSGRSSCKTCSDNIAHKTLRFGVVTKDKNRGQVMTNWHHFHCFSFDYCAVSSSESVQGFNSLKTDDQEAIKKLVEEHGKVKGKGEEAIAEDKEESTKKRKSRDRDEDEVGKKQESPKNLQFSVTEQRKVKIALQASDLKDLYEDAILLPKWKAFQTIIFLEKDDGLKDTSKIAAFDFDGCLAKTDVKRTGADAWELMYPSIPDKLQELYNDGYKIVIFTNESNISRWKNKRQKAVDSKVGRLNNFIKLMKVPIQVFIACGYGSNDPYRKPKIGMWLVMEQHFNSGIPVDMNKSFYVGDAAGRKNDHSAADIDFAKGIGLKFYVPEEFFVE